MIRLSTPPDGRENLLTVCQKTKLGMFSRFLSCPIVFLKRVFVSSPQNFLHAVFGFLFFLAVGSVEIDACRKKGYCPGIKSAALGLGSMAIFTSFAFLGEAALLGISVAKGERGGDQ